MTTAVRGRRITQAIDHTDPYLLVARLTLVLVIINTPREPTPLALAAGTCAVMFLNPRLLRSPGPWFLIAAVLGASQAADWWLVDNHKFATTAWVLTIGLSRLARDPKRTLRESARLFIGVLFGCAFAWKLLSPSYLSGAFFQYTLLRDERFEPVAVVVARADESRLERDRSSVVEFTSSATVDQSIEVPHGPATRLVALVLTGWGLVLEGVIALVFLAPLNARHRRMRPAALLLFCATTYAIAPIVGFGFLLMTVGLALVQDARLRRIFVFGSAAVFLWSAVVAGLAT